MSRMILAIAISTTLALGGLSAGWAGSPPPAGQAPAAADVRQVRGGPEQPARPSVMPEPERLLHKPSGFWTSGRPAVGGAYRYRLLAIGFGVFLVMAAITVWVVRRYPQRRA